MHFTAICDSLRYQHTIVVLRSNRTLTYVCPCCTVALSESSNPKRLSAPSSKLSMWHSDTTLMSPKCCVFVCPLLSAERHIGSWVSDGHNAVEQVLIEKLLVTQPIKKLTVFGTAWMSSIVLARDNHWVHPEPADSSKKNVVPAHSTKVYRRIKRTVPSILGTRHGQVVIFTSRSLYPRGLTPEHIEQEAV